MATKTISITEEAYERLSVKKHEKESFSEVITRITNKVNILDFAGILNKNESEKLSKSIEELRNLSKNRLKRIRI